MRTLGLILWTCFAVWLGTFLATARVGGRTPLQHFEQAWARSPADAKLGEVKTRVKETLEDARDALAPEAEARPRERHSAKDREEVNKLIAGAARR